MIVELKIGSARIEVDGASVKEIFEKAEELTVFEHCKCGACGSDVLPFHKTPQSYNFYGFRCVKCGAELLFNEAKTGAQKGKLFVGRDTLQEPDGGWKVFNPKPKQEQLIEEDDDEVPF